MYLYLQKSRVEIHHTNIFDNCDAVCSEDIQAEGAIVRGISFPGGQLLVDQLPWNNTIVYSYTIILVNSVGLFFA